MDSSHPTTHGNDLINNSNVTHTSEGENNRLPAFATPSSSSPSTSSIRKRSFFEGPIKKFIQSFGNHEGHSDAGPSSMTSTINPILDHHRRQNLISWTWTPEALSLAIKRNNVSLTTEAHIRSMYSNNYGVSFGARGDAIGLAKFVIGAIAGVFTGLATGYLSWSELNKTPYVPVPTQFPNVRLNLQRTIKLGSLFWRCVKRGFVSGLLFDTVEGTVAGDAMQMDKVGRVNCSHWITAGAICAPIFGLRVHQGGTHLRMLCGTVFYATTIAVFCGIRNI